MPFFNPLLDEKEFKRVYIRYPGVVEDVIKTLTRLTEREEKLLVRRRGTIAVVTRTFSCRIYFNGKLVKLNSRVIKALEKEAKKERPYQLPIDVIVEVKYRVSGERRRPRKDVIVIRIRKTRKGAYLMYSAKKTSMMKPRLVVKILADMLKASVTESLSATL
ncbi:MAG: hypothetical protein DRN96_01880 [Thermoproteota archaeon]|nr:MAG: hypothetical protein DRN96_01880 [Candidatus Korarchaeota archaeon]RLG55924.1 MAG: hypothetical protein DRN99_01140 [Candidatus Korarchaeota archaeon]